MDAKKKLYTQTELNASVDAVKTEYEQVLAEQRARISDLRKSLAAAERKIAQYESQKEIVYKAITTALKKADDIERVSLIKYNQEIAQLKSFHDKWVAYFNRIIAAYPLDENLAAACKVNGKIAETLERTGDIEEQYNAERDRLMQSLQNESDDAATADQTLPQDDEYSDRSPAGFSFAEALHPKDDLKDIMRELGVIIDEDD